MINLDLIISRFDLLSTKVHYFMKPDLDRINYLITGGTGLIGRSLRKSLSSLGATVDILSRNPSSDPHSYLWNPEKLSLDFNALSNGQCIVNLAGASIAGSLWTSAYKKKILQSRLDAILTLEQSLRLSGIRPGRIIQASAIGIYGNDHRQAIVESEVRRSSKDFLADVVDHWEREAECLRSLTDQLIFVRIGLVLSSDGGFLRPLLWTKKLGFVNWFGKGDQISSWIDIRDLLRGIQFISTIADPKPVYHLTAPNPVSQKILVQYIAKSSARKCLAFSIHEWLVRFIPGGMSELFLNGASVIPENLLSQGFEFDYPDVEKSLNSLLLN